MTTPPMMHVAAILYTEATQRADEDVHSATPTTDPDATAPLPLPWLEPDPNENENENGLPPKEEPVPT